MTPGQNPSSPKPKLRRRRRLQQHLTSRDHPPARARPPGNVSWTEPKSQRSPAPRGRRLQARRRQRSKRPLLSNHHPRPPAQLQLQPPPRLEELDTTSVRRERRSRASNADSAGLQEVDNLGQSAHRPRADRRRSRHGGGQRKPARNDEEGLGTSSPIRICLEVLAIAGELGAFGPAPPARGAGSTPPARIDVQNVLTTVVVCRRRIRVPRALAGLGGEHRLSGTRARPGRPSGRPEALPDRLSKIRRWDRRPDS